MRRGVIKFVIVSMLLAAVHGLFILRAASEVFRYFSIFALQKRSKPLRLPVHPPHPFSQFHVKLTAFFQDIEKPLPSLVNASWL